MFGFLTNNVVISKQTFNTLYLGLTFGVLFSAYNGFANILKRLQLSIQEDNGDYNVDGWTSLGLLYTIYGFALWLAPSVIAIIQTKLTLIIGASCYLLATLSYFLENGLATYIATVILGIGASLLWTSHANYIVMNSEIGKVSKSISIFCIFLESSNFPGNILIYLRLHDTKKMDTQTRKMILCGVSVLTVISIVMLCFLGKPVRKEPTDSPLNTNKDDGPIDALARAWSIAKTNDMIILAIAFVFAGMQLTFVHVISTSMGFTSYFADREELVPLGRISIGIGGVIGGLFVRIIGNKKYGKINVLITTSTIANVACYAISFLGLSNESSSHLSNQSPIMQLPKSVLMLACFMAGLGEVCLLSQLYDIIGGIFPYNGAASFAVFRFVRSVTTGASFFYSSIFGLYIQLVILTICCLMTLFAVHFVHHGRH